MASSECPVPSTHRRLMDCHVHWHAAAGSYMDPEAFRVSLNALVQDLRNVTWLLQKQKRELPGFEEWYPAWQSSAAADEVMRWIVSARNRVVKVADLETHSLALIRLARGSVDEVSDELNLPPRLTTDQIMSYFLSRMPSTVTSGVMTVERRWVDKELPGAELLDATAHAYDRLVEVVRRAHDASGVRECDLAARVPECVDARLLGGLVCMSQADRSRRLHVDVSSMMEKTEGYAVIRRTEGPPPEALRELYGSFKRLGGDAIAQVLPATGLAKRMLRVDKKLATAAWLIRDGELVDLMKLAFDDVAGTRIGIHRLADRVATKRADGVVLLSEAWWAPPTGSSADDHGRPIPPSERPDRGEAIWIVGITRDGRIRESLTRFTRDADGAIHFERPQFTDGRRVSMLEPIEQRWAAMDATHS